jgi:hypothetical protein
MRRLLTVVFSCVLLSGVLLADAKCPKPPIPREKCPKITEGCPNAVIEGVCTVPLDYFIKYQECTGDHGHDHAPIEISVGGYLLITNGNGSSIKEKFSVGQFTEYNDPTSANCDQSGTKLDKVGPFYEPFIESLQDSHKLQAMRPGCYKVNLTLNQEDPDNKGQSCTIDPHIIIRGGGAGGLSLQIKQLKEEIKELDETLKEIKKELKDIEKEQKKDSKHHE